jgi:hypothetical protein
MNYHIEYLIGYNLDEELKDNGRHTFLQTVHEIVRTWKDGGNVAMGIVNSPRDPSNATGSTTAAGVQDTVMENATGSATAAGEQQPIVWDTLIADVESFDVNHGFWALCWAKAEESSNYFDPKSSTMV